MGKDARKETKEVLRAFVRKLEGNMKTLPPEALKDINERPWDFV